MDKDLFAIGLPDLVKKRLASLTGVDVEFKVSQADYPVRCEYAGPFLYQGQAFLISIFDDEVRIHWCTRWSDVLFEVYRGHAPEAVAQEFLEFIEAIFGPPEVLEKVHDRSKLRELRSWREAAWKKAWKL